MRHRLKIALSPAVLALAVGFTAAEAGAWSASADTGLELAQSAQSQLPEEKLEAYAGAAERVNELQREWVPRLEDAESEAEVAKLRAQANQEMVAAIEAAGLSVEQYNAITIAAREDPALLERIKTYMR